MKDIEMMEGNAIIDLLVNKFIEDETLYSTIDKTENIFELSCLFQLQYERIERKIAAPTNFSVAKILQSECLYEIKLNTLVYALRVQADDREMRYCINVLNEKLSMLNLNLQQQWDKTELVEVLNTLWLAAVIIEVNGDLEHGSFIHLNLTNLKNFILKMCTLKMSKDISIDKFSLFFEYCEAILLRDSKFCDETLQYCINEENLFLLCLLFEKKILDIITCSYFHDDVFWNFVKIHISGEDNIKKKQAEFVLWIVIEHIKTHNMAVPNALQTEVLKNWDFFFILLEMSKEKQLHLIQPTLKFLPLITKLHISWQNCLYKELLKHSQITVVYEIVKHLLKFEYNSDQYHQEILGSILKALNRFEYSNGTKDIFLELEMFSDQLNENCYSIFFEEFLKIDWNPAAAWSVLIRTTKMLRKFPPPLVLKVLICLKKLPHLCIKRNSIAFFIEKLLHNSCYFFENIMLIGKFLISTDHPLDKEIFHFIVQKLKYELEKYWEKIKDIILRPTHYQNTEELIVVLEIMKQLNKECLSDYSITNSNSSDIILSYFPNILDPLAIETYLIERLKSMGASDKYFFKLLKTLLDEGSVKISGEKCLDLWNNSQNDKDIKFFVCYLICRNYDQNVLIDRMLLKEAESFLKFNKYIAIELWIGSFRKMLENKQEVQQINELSEECIKLLYNDDENDLKTVVYNLDIIIKCTTSGKHDSIHILDLCMKKLCSLPNQIMKKYSAEFFKSIFVLDLFSIQKFAECWEKWNLELFDGYFLDCDGLLKIMLEGCRKIILLKAPYAHILTPFVLKALTKGMVTQKNQKVEYGVCQEIHDTIKVPFIENPNITAAEIKMISIECLYLLAENKTNKAITSADNLMEMLLDLYMNNYNKRYFPDSKMHLEKLRIVQAMLIIVPFTEKSREKIVQFILKSFSEEAHQSSVKQLLQWLLIILTCGTPNYLKFMIEKVRAANLCNLSSIVALIPAMFHLLISIEDEVLWYDTTDALLPWLMGAQFKLRVYAQVTLQNIIKRAKEKSFGNYVSKYSFLEESIGSVLNATGSSVLDTLKHDIIFIEVFDPHLYYSVENIFVFLPKLLDVPPYEWQNTLDHHFSEEFHMKVETDFKLPINDNKNNVDYKENENVLCTANVQKKIIPWKQDLKEKIENSSLNNLICVASLVEKPNNIGGLSRTCEIFNVKHLVLSNIKIKDDKEFKHLSMSSENWVDFLEVKRDDLSNFLMKLRENGYLIIGLEQTSESVKLNQFKFEKKSVILLGNEKEGIPAPLLPFLDICVEIPQFGQTRSLNVHVAGATLIWEYVKQHML